MQKKVPKSRFVLCCETNFELRLTFTVNKTILHLTNCFPVFFIAFALFTSKFIFLTNKNLLFVLNACFTSDHQTFAQSIQGQTCHGCIYQSWIFLDVHLSIVTLLQFGISCHDTLIMA